MSASDKKISLSKATTWTTNWRNAPSTSARAFLIPVQDLQGAMAEMDTSNPNACIRAYLGIDDTTGEEKMIIVGTKIDRSGVYRDLLPDSDEGTNGNSIWDFSRPCPPHCDDDSQLN